MFSLPHNFLFLVFRKQISNMTIQYLEGDDDATVVGNPKRILRDGRKTPAASTMAQAVENLSASCAPIGEAHITGRRLTREDIHKARILSMPLQIGPCRKNTLQIGPGSLNSFHSLGCRKLYVKKSCVSQLC